MSHTELVSWSERVAVLLREICADAQAASGDPQGEDQCPDIRALLFEYQRIQEGLTAWQARVNDQCDLWEKL